MAVVIQSRGDTSSNWATINPVLADREFGIETDTGKLKFGNGIDSWNERPYTSSGRRVVSVTLTDNTVQAVSTAGMTFPLRYFVAPQSGSSVRVQVTGGSASASIDVTATEVGDYVLAYGEVAPTAITFQLPAGVGAAFCGVEG